MNVQAWVALPPAVPPATTYGHVIDHIWAMKQGETGRNVARRSHWPDDTYIVVYPCVDLAPITDDNRGAMQEWVFFDNGLTYVPSDEDCEATDWRIGVLPDDDDNGYDGDEGCPA